MRVYLEVRIYIIWTNYTGVRSQLRETLIAERRQCDPVRVRLGGLMISIRDATKMYSDREKIRFGHFFLDVDRLDSTSAELCAKTLVCFAQPHRAHYAL